MRLASYRVFRADAREEELPQSQTPELPEHTPAVAAGNQGQGEGTTQPGEDTPRVGQQARIFSPVSGGPQPVGSIPLRSRNSCGPVDAVPVGGIMAIELFIRKIDSKGAEHRSIGPEVRAEGIQQRAVPVQEDYAGGENGIVHPSRLPYKAAKILMGRRRDEIVAIEIDVVKRSGEAAPARDAAIFRAHNVSCSS